ncbi:hypothetical protein CCR75_007592 [Bremia lactucae]|uniref:Uncharacterized protein n=1 Tax=Bremia lactucae TaxID=4779 RepID=A0A976NYX8_BRELC|nr:hypothetical protein CCR75_007592 [Bremia lactucae]
MFKIFIDRDDATHISVETFNDVTIDYNSLIDLHTLHVKLNAPKDLRRMLVAALLNVGIAFR